jgi:hypothetical protein
MASLAEQCSHPITLTRSVIDTATGVVSDPEAFRKACGSRLADRCPSCSEVYRRDLMTLIGEGLQQEVDRGVTMSFLTFTAPGAEVFGQTHTRPTKDRNDGTTYAYPCPCGVRHFEHAPVLGTPIDPSTYDYAAAANWNANASRLLAVTMQRLSRMTYPNSPRTSGVQRQLQWVRVAEFQRRGLVHFHVIVRGRVKQEHLEAVVRGAGTPGKPDYIKPTTSRGIGWGTQCDLRRVAKGAKHGVGFYLLKVIGYATKNAGGGGAGLDGHERQMATAGAESCSCDHALTCNDGPTSMTVTVLDDEGKPTTVTVANLSKRHHDRCVRHRLARRGWGFRGHIFAASHRWGVTLKEIRARRCQHRSVVTLPTVGAFERAREIDPSLPIPAFLVEWNIEPSSYLRR